ncbi:ABC transporter ATP-binding protein [Nocardioides sp. LHG3406-4]|uniref:ABC transporter ATP-binding protein n=1 Tax=Nocardioides sp. LHG3406-4 TaxID=2804575 RepID=UPI003CF76D83
MPQSTQAESSLDDVGGDDALVSARGLTKTYSSGRGTVTALEGLDLEIRNGEFISLLGPSGCGKSTALNIIGGLLPASAGTVHVKGEQITGPRRDIGMMFQKAVMLPWRTTLKNVLLPIEVFGRSKSDYLDRAHELLEMVGISEFADSYPWQLSGGMQQRAALCRVLIHDPDLLLLDEPFGALDEFTRETMNKELLRVHAHTKKTTILVTHNISEAVFMSDRIAVMSARPGRLIDVIDVPFGRPRETELMRTQEFADIMFEARALLDLR